MNIFKKKRDQLELFTKEQIIGPGAYNKHFFFLEDWNNKEFFNSTLRNELAIRNETEIIPEVPAYQYSSAILFPETKLKSKTVSQPENQSLPQANNIIEEEISENINTSADDENLKTDITENLVSKQQNYPNQFGLSFVIHRNTKINDELIFLLSFRKYVNHSRSSCFQKKLGVWIPEYEVQIKDAIEKYFNSIFKIEEKDMNFFVTLKSKINKKDIYDIDYVYLNQYLKENLIPKLDEAFDNKIVFLKEKKGTSYYGVKGEINIQLYSKKQRSYGETIFENVITLFDAGIINEIKKHLQTQKSNYSKYHDIIQLLEIYNQLKKIVTDLKSIFKAKNPTPIWESKPYKIKLILPEYDDQKNIDRKEIKSIAPENKELKDLKFQVQYIKKNEKLYVKIVIINKFSIELKEGEPPQLNKKNNANLKSFFGVELKVIEAKKKTLLQYNPLQLLDIDEEDNFNKLLYKQFIDYGEGYNTSVSWGNNESELRYITTDFLPQQETPKVDFVPSEVKNGTIKPLIADINILSMRRLSSLSEVNDSEIISNLNEFIDKYGDWIEERKNDVLDSEELLGNQLKACKNDYKRLKRNIKLLEKNESALAAFRVMNTAMFMQLHHGILIKDKISFHSNLDQKYYETVVLKEEYKWRSFQLAFVLLNIDAFVKPDKNDRTVPDLFESGWPERNEIADLVWFPTGGGKTEAYLGIIAFAIALRRFTKGTQGNGTTVLMRYTLRLLTLQQFQRATLLICALEVIRKDQFSIPNNYNLGAERITIGLFVGAGSLPNRWKDSSNSEGMRTVLKKISTQVQNQIDNNRETIKIKTNLPFTDCPWCGSNLFINGKLENVLPNHNKEEYSIKDELSICCHNKDCSFSNDHPKFPIPELSLPLRLFDEDIYKFPPTLLFGTVDKFAAFANNISTVSGEVKKDSRRLVGKGYLGRNQHRDILPPELIIQDELHLLLGPLGTAVGLFEKGIDYLCTYKSNGISIRPKIVTSTATTRNTDKQIFALFNRRSEIFPKQGISCDDSFFAYYKRDKKNINEFISNRKYIGILPVGKTQVWMHLRIAAITMTHRLKFLKDNYTIQQIFEDSSLLESLNQVMDYYHTTLSYFNSLKDVGKTQSQLSHYLPGDVNYVTKNTVPWSFLDKILRKEGEINYSELTGRLTGEEVKTNLSEIDTQWNLFFKKDNLVKLKKNFPPEYVISTNMISVGIDVSRFNTMIISSMPRNIAEYIQASSRVARSKIGIVFTIHHPFRSRDISHYQKFKEFHEKFYSYVEPISVTPFASKALDRYLAMLLAVLIRHNEDYDLMNNNSASGINSNKASSIKRLVLTEIKSIIANAEKLDLFLRTRDEGIKSNVDGIISNEELTDLERKIDSLLNNWIARLSGSSPVTDLKYRDYENKSESLYISVSDDNYPDHWKVSHSLREIAPSTVIKTTQQ